LFLVIYSDWLVQTQTSAPTDKVFRTDMLALFSGLALQLDASPDDGLFHVCIDPKSDDVTRTSKSASVRVASCCARYPDSPTCSKLDAFCKLIKPQADLSLCAKYFRYLANPRQAAAGGQRRLGFVSCLFYGAVWVGLLFLLTGPGAAVALGAVGVVLAWKAQLWWVCVTLLVMSGAVNLAGLLLLPLCVIGMVLQGLLGGSRLLSAVAALFIAPAAGAFGGVTCWRSLKTGEPTRNILGLRGLAEAISRLIGAVLTDTMAAVIGAFAALLVAIVPALIWHWLNAIVITTTTAGFLAATLWLI
jgi:hypothetical protein